MPDFSLNSPTPPELSDVDAGRLAAGFLADGGVNAEDGFALALRGEKRGERSLVARTKPRWQPWENGLTNGAWSARIEDLTERRELIAVVMLNPSGRATMSLRVEETGAPMVCVFNAHKRGVRSPEAARSWAEDALETFLASEQGQDSAQPEIATSRPHRSSEENGGRIAVDSAERGAAAAAPGLVLHTIVSCDWPIRADRRTMSDPSKTSLHTSTIYDIYYEKLYISLWSDEV